MPSLQRRSPVSLSRFLPAIAVAAALLALGWPGTPALVDLTAAGQAPAADAAPPPSAMAKTVRIPSPSLGNDYTFAVLLPYGYADSGKRYPVLYLLHGGGQTHTAFPSRMWFTKDAAARNMIVVLPNGGRSFFVNSVGLPDARYEDVIAKDVVEYVDAHYRTLATREGRAIGGISMGGFGSAVLGLRHPDLFGTVGPLSAPMASASSRGGNDNPTTILTFGRPSSPERKARDPLTLVMEIPAQTAPFFYLACGLDDPLLPASREFARLLAGRQLAHQYVEMPGGHSWNVWDPQLRAFFDVLAARPGWIAR